MKPGALAIIGLSVFLTLWYGVVFLYNHRCGRRLFRWLEAGLDVLGEERASGWIGSAASGARINVIHANSPFRRLEITLLLENREVPLLWLLDRLRGRRDRIIIRAMLRSPRRGEVSVSSDKRTLPHQEQSWTWQTGPNNLTIARRGHKAQRQVEALRPWLETYGNHLHPLSWHKQDPHIVLQMRIAGPLRISAEAFLTDFCAALNANMGIPELKPPKPALV